MSDGMIIFSGLLITAVVIFLGLFFTRSLRDFMSIFGVAPEEATQDIIDKKIGELQLTLWQKEEGLPKRNPTELDMDLGGIAQNKLERAIKVACKFGFNVPLTNKEGL